MNINDTIQALLGATREQTRAKALIDLLRARLEEQARTRTREDGAAPTWKAPSGTVRWDVPTEPAIVITGADDLASHLAQRVPGAVTARIQVPAEQVEEALQILHFGGITGASVTLDLDQAAAQRWLTTHAAIHPGDTQTGWEVLEIDPGAESPTRGTPIPGVRAERRSPRLVVTLARKLKDEALADGIAEARHVLAEPVEPDTTAPTIPTPRAPQDTPGVQAVTAAHLRAACRNAGLPVSGTKAELAARLTHHTQESTS